MWTEIFISIGFLLWYILSMVVSEQMGKHRRIGTEWSFFICFMFSPIVGYLVTRYSPEK